MTVSQHPRRFSQYQALSFDCYGTLVDWENGLLQALSPLLSRLPEDHSLRTSTVDALSVFQKAKAGIMQRHPTMLYTAVLRKAYEEVATSLALGVTEHEAEAFSGSIQGWQAFPDTHDALHQLSRHFRLAILSNVDNESFRQTLAGPLHGVQFDVVCTAEDIGSYKPAHRNFDYLHSKLHDQFGIDRSQVLHVAQSLVHDHVPAKELGIDSVWISRGKERRSGMGGDLDTLQDRVAFAWRFDTLDQLATMVEEEKSLT